MDIRWRLGIVIDGPIGVFSFRELGHEPLHLVAAMCVFGTVRGEHREWELETNHNTVRRTWNASGACIPSPLRRRLLNDDRASS